MDFAQIYFGGPVQLKQFVELMQGCVADYEQRYGAIELPSEP